MSSSTQKFLCSVSCSTDQLVTSLAEDGKERLPSPEDLRHKFIIKVGVVDYRSMLQLGHP